MIDAKKRAELDQGYAAALDVACALMVSPRSLGIDFPPIPDDVARKLAETTRFSYEVIKSFFD